MKVREFLTTLLLPLSIAASLQGADFESELLFPLEPWHNHSPSIVETPDGGLLAVWFHGSGERKADDVQVRGSRRAPGASEWEPAWVAADTPGFPDTNCVVWVDSQQRLWLFWMTFVANLPESTILQYRVSSDYLNPGQPPTWERQEPILLKHDMDRFSQTVREWAAPLLREASPEQAAYLARVVGDAQDKYKSRMGWMVRTHPIQLDSGRLLLGLYSDLYDFSLMAISDDSGSTWRPGLPLIGGGAVQPSVVVRQDGSLVAFLRDNGNAPKRMLRSVSKDAGETWSVAEDTDHPNPGSSVEAIRLRDGRLLLVSNDTENGRHSLAVSLSTNEGATWDTAQHLEQEREGEGSFSYPSVIQARDGRVHVAYSVHIDSEHKAIKHASFTPAWLPPLH